MKVLSIPIKRNAMAEYLNVERGALSRELSNKKRDEIIEFDAYLRIENAASQ